MSKGLLVELPDGKLIRKDSGELLPGDRVVFDGPGAFESTERLQSALAREIEAAGGLEAWRALTRTVA